MKVSPAPIRDIAVDVPKNVGLTGLMTAVWLNWVTHLWQSLGRVSARVGGVSLETQGAAIATTAIATTALSTGLYRVTYSVRVTRAATTSSSLTVTIGWTAGGIACSQAGAAVVGNTTASQQNGTFVVRADVATTITYALAYASVGGTSMQYRVDVVVEELP